MRAAADPEHDAESDEESRGVCPLQMPGEGPRVSSREGIMNNVTDRHVQVHGGLHRLVPRQHRRGEAESEGTQNYYLKYLILIKNISECAELP